jgi:hypothetical protein
VGCPKPDPERESAFLSKKVLAPRKEAWQAALGGAEAAKPQIRARLAGWPRQLVADRAALPRDDEAFLQRLAADTWRGIEALTDREHGLPVDHVRFCDGSVAVADAKLGDYTTGTNIGLHLMSVVAALELELISRETALAMVRRELESLERLETYHGFAYNFYDTTTLERTTHFVSFVDSAWLVAGLVVARQAFPEVYAACSALITEKDFAFFYDSESHLMVHGFRTNPGGRSPLHYGVLYTEARVGSLLAIGKGDVPEEHWFRMQRTFPPEAMWQSRRPQGRRPKTVLGYPLMGGWYDWQGMRYVPSWGGSMFEALMPMLVLDEEQVAPRSLGRNGQVHASLQRRYATETLGYPVWGMSPSAIPDSIEYGEYGVRDLGILGYPAGVVTPYASALALAVAPEAAAANLRQLAERYDAYGEYGLYDAVDPKSGEVAHAYLALDQSMTFLALANHLKDGCIRKRFMADPIVQKVLPMLGAEDFLD